MPTETKLPADISERLLGAFGLETLEALVPQQSQMLDVLVNKVAREEGPEALTHDRLLGIKELVTEHLWDSGFNGLV